MSATYDMILLFPGRNTPVFLNKKKITATMWLKYSRSASFSLIFLSLTLNKHFTISRQLEYSTDSLWNRSVRFVQHWYLIILFTVVFSMYPQICYILAALYIPVNIYPISIFSCHITQNLRQGICCFTYFVQYLPT